MGTDSLEKLRELFDDAAGLQSSERRAFLSNCGADAELVNEIVALLAEPNGTNTSLNGIRLREVAASKDICGRNHAGLVVPQLIGPYRIIDLVGVGGMGAVYSAEQKYPCRIVALKVIRADRTTPDMLRRFAREAQALGRLQHPGIAQIYEAGTVDTGLGRQPYFAMEFIRGLSLVDYAEVNQLGTRRRLETIAKVCDAVQHAHQRGLIHRDLKPGNILVDETGQPKVLDFGVACMTDRDPQATCETGPGQLVGTLAYMSPEQVLGDPLELDTRSDVYALGVILYELLAGRLPFIPSRRLEEVVLTIRDRAPAPLGSFNRKYGGDIEIIVAKALENDKARRYASAAALAVDIRCYLADEPIAARPPSASYQLRKFTNRHKLLVISLVTVVTVLIAGIIASTVAARRARRAEQVALHERDRTAAAEQNAQTLLERTDKQAHQVEGLIIALEAAEFKEFAPGKFSKTVFWPGWRPKNSRPSMWPLSGVLIVPFGAIVDPFDENGSHGDPPNTDVEDGSGFHTGVDIGAPVGSPVRATADGKVVFSSLQKASPGAVVIDHGGGVQTVYIYLLKVSVHSGKKVRRGDQVGEAAAPRLHYEVRIGGAPVNPLRYPLSDVAGKPVAVQRAQ